MPTHELRNLRITKIALVRKGFRPVNDGARITIVKAEEDPMTGTAATEDSVVQRLSKALAGLLKGDGESTDPPKTTDADVEKASAKVTSDQLNVGADGSHAPMTGKHSHDHVSHYAVMTHGHDHEHDGDGNHYHDHVVKAEAMDELVKAAVEPMVTEALKPLTEQVSALVAKNDEISKAAVTDEHIAEVVNKALEPLAKSIEDLAVAFHRQPKTPNVTADIRPGAASANGTAVTLAEIKDQDFSTAIRTALHR